MLSKQARQRVKVNHAKRILRHALKLVKKDKPDLDGVCRAMNRMNRGKVVSWSDILERMTEESKVKVISKVDAKDGEFLQTFRARLGQVVKEDRTLWFTETNPFPARLRDEPELLLIHLGLATPQLL